MEQQFKAYWFCVFLKAFSGIFLLINYLLGIDILFLFKVPLILSSLIILFYHVKKTFFFGFIAALFSAYVFLGTGVAIYYGNSLSTKTLSHLYTIFICMFGVSFGYYFARYYNKNIDGAVRKYMQLLFFVTIVILLIYYYSYYFTGKIEYFGFDTELPTSIVFFVGQGQTGLFVITILLIFLSGKRSPLISVLVISLIFLIKAVNFKKIKNLIIGLLLLMSISVAIVVAYNNGLLWRFESVIAVDIEDEDSFYTATSGRSAEFMGILNHMNADTKRWYIGSGLGGAYYIDIIRGDYEERYQHYTHLSLLSFVFLFGVPFVILLVGYIFFLVVKNFKYYKNKYYLGMIVTFVSSLFGAGMFVDSIFWVFLGINAYMRTASKDSSIICIK
ncbi:hypothetical protein [Sediminibacterium goheungense]|uniref:O-antigen ligase-like membrane protein n=1 Tax=Sediminibacterium goheungense TaxID=1086393 RepID=A0A4R6IW32_9BACT|nr:hypothetical protein [Sediminibacterium goheungense]TDO26919.1 hypothetical protein BC659_2234 [Sediminibacterium goheungense]